MKQKLFTLLLAIAASVGTMLAEKVHIGDLYYNLNETDQTAEVTYELSASENNYSGLTTANIPASVTYSGKNYSVTSIGDYSFQNCRSLTSVTIPHSVTRIKSCAFYNCSSLISVTIPNSVTSIEDAAFYYCSSLTSVTIPNSITSIEDAAFYYCSSLTSVTIPNSITSIGERTFYNCSGLISIEIPHTVTRIGNKAFSYCSSLTSVTIPNSVTSIGEGAFSDCSGLTSMFVEAGNTIYDSRDNCNAIIETASNTLIAGCKNTIIPNSVTSIGEAAFSGCSSLTSVTIPNSVTSIGDRAFEYCYRLTSVTIPNSVTSIGNNAFTGCSSLTVVDNLRYADTYLVEAVDKTLSSYTIKEGTRWIGSSAFRECGSLSSITIPNSVTSIGDYAFYYCSSLTSVAIGSSVTSIGYRAFWDCSNLSKIYSLPQTPPSISSNTFSGIATEAVVYVSSSALSAYKSASYWNDMNIVGMKAEAQTTESPTSVVITASQDLWKVFDEYIYQIGIEGGEQEAGNTLEYIGLEPNSEYKDVPVVLTSNIGETETVNVTFTTTALTLTTQQPKVVSSTTAILLAETNMSDAEVNCGFEWKRENAPDAMAGTKVYCPVANGTMAGRLKGLKDDVYYKYRAFYQSTAGNTYYGDWQYIFTGDDAVEFDPVMYTYAASAVTETEATLKGYALAGSDEFTEQGFEYWAESRVIPEGANHAPVRAYQNAIGEHQSVQATGISMKVTLTNLDEGTVYKYRTYAVVNGAKVYGSEMSFTTRGEYLYTVTFVDYDGTILGSDKVHYGTAATAPEDPSRDGYNFAGWDKDYSNVTDDLTITAQYTVSTALPQATTDSCVQKFIRDGQVLIMRDGKMYNLQGVEMK